MEDDEAMLWFARGYMAREREIFAPPRVAAGAKVLAQATQARVMPGEFFEIPSAHRTPAKRAYRKNGRKRSPLSAEHKAKISAARRRSIRAKARAAK